MCIESASLVVWKETFVLLELGGHKGRGTFHKTIADLFGMGKTVCYNCFALLRLSNNYY